MVVPFPSRAMLATARAGKPEGQGFGGVHCRVAVRLCRSLHGATGALLCLSAKPLRSPSLTVNTP